MLNKYYTACVQPCAQDGRRARCNAVREPREQRGARAGNARDASRPLRVPGREVRARGERSVNA